MTDSTWAWLATFALSPGFGGAAAVCAALIALAAARMTSRRQSEQAANDRRQRARADARTQWWTRFAWAAERLDSPREIETDVASAVVREILLPVSGTVDDDIAAAVSRVVTFLADDDLPLDIQHDLDEGGTA